MNRYISTLAAMAGASLLSLGLSSRYYSGQLESQAYRAKIELERAGNYSLPARAPVFEKPSAVIGLVCIIADVDGDGVPEMRLFAPDGRQILSEDDLEYYGGRELKVENF